MLMEAVASVKFTIKEYVFQEYAKFLILCVNEGKNRETQYR